MLEPLLIERTSLHREVEKIEAAVWNNQALFSNATYESGFLGPALFYAYMWLYTNDTTCLTRSEHFLEKGLSSLDVHTFKRGYKTDSLDNHIAQVGRFLEFMKATGVMRLDADEIIASFDQVLFKLMMSKIDIADFDIQSGALAAGYCYLSRTTQTEQIAEYLSILVKGIDAKAVPDQQGHYSWPSSSALYNRTYLGISHGNALIISFVCHVYNRGIEQAVCTRILDKAAGFLLHFKSDFGKGLFPNFVGEEDQGPKQFSLCYGDIGIGYALLKMGLALNAPDILHTATAILNNCTTRKKEDKLTLDAGITYGAAGLAITFEEIHRLTGNSLFSNAAAYWYAAIPEYAQHANQFAGYRSRVSMENDGIWDLNFAWGITGIGTSLVRRLHPQLPSLAPLLLIA
jgi:lantibiotic biosynthesis protein